MKNKRNFNLNSANHKPFCSITVGIAQTTVSSLYKTFLGVNVDNQGKTDLILKHHKRMTHKWCTKQLKLPLRILDLDIRKVELRHVPLLLSERRARRPLNKRLRGLHI